MNDRISALAAVSDETPSARQQWLLTKLQQWPANDLRRLHYTLCFIIRIRPKFDFKRLSNAFNHVLSIHEVLRWSFLPQNGGWKVKVYPLDCFRIGQVDASKWDEPRLKKFLRQAAKAPWDLSVGPLCEITVYSPADDSHVLFLRFHHLIFDGWSINIILRDLLTEYMGTRTLSEPRSSRPYAEFAQLQRAFIESGAGHQELEFWRARLFDLPDRLPLPRTRSFTDAITSSLSSTLVLGADFLENLHRRSRAARSSPFRLLFAAYNIFLYELTGIRDVPITTVIANRKREFMGTVGWFGNHIAIREELDLDEDLDSYIARFSGSIAESIDQSQYPFHLVREAVEGEHPKQLTCLDQVGFSMIVPDRLDDFGFGALYFNSAKVSYGRFSGEFIELELETCLRDLDFRVQQYNGCLYLSAHFNADSFDAVTAEKAMNRYVTIVSRILDSPSIPIKEILGAT